MQNTDLLPQVDAEKRQLSLGLKPSYFQDDSTSDESDEEDSADEMVHIL